MTKVISEKNENHNNWSWQKGMKLKIKYHLYISIADLVRAKESQKVINILTKIYDDNKAEDAEEIRVTPFTDSYIKGICISFKCISKDEVEKYKKEFNIIYKDLTFGAERKPTKKIQMINLETCKISKF